MSCLSLAVIVSLLSHVYGQAYTATYTPQNAPDKTEQGQIGTNKCGTTNSQTSMCQNSYLNSLDDFCLWAPPKPGPGSDIGSSERIEVAWCTKPGYGTRLIPDGAIKGAHFIQTPDYVQITGIGDLTLINVLPGDTGGELDPHGADGNGNPIGGLVFSSAFGKLQQIHEWTNFMSATEFCFRACNPAGKQPAAMCQHIYDVMGCAWNMPARYDAGVFETCKGDSALPMGVYGASTFHQGDGQTPPAHPIPSSSLCTTVNTIGSRQTASVAPSLSGSASSALSPTGLAVPSGSGPSRSNSAQANTIPSGSGANSPQPSNNAAGILKVGLINVVIGIIASSMITGTSFL